jgi:hypothetical protein
MCTASRRVEYQRTPNLFVMARGKVKRAFRLLNSEKEFLDQILDNATCYVKIRDKQMCSEYARRPILGDNKVLQRATATLRPVVMAKIKCVRDNFYKRLLERHASFLALPKPLRGKELLKKASELGLLTRVETVKVDVATIKQECQFAPVRLKMKMHDEIGRDCAREVVHKRKRKECIQKIVDLAQQTGVADVTLVWRDFSDCSQTMVKVDLAGLTAVCRLPSVYVLDIHKQTYLYPFPIFLSVIKILTNSTIFAINMGEDNMIMDNAHFQLLAARIEDGSIALRRWFVESNKERRKTQIKYKLVSKEHNTRKKAKADNPNVWTIARRRDEELWIQGQRHLPMLSWLTAPPSAYEGATNYKTDMQNKTCNWVAACALRAKAEENHSNTNYKPVLFPLPCMDLKPML